MTILNCTCCASTPLLLWGGGGVLPPDSPASLLLLGLKRRFFQDFFSMANTHIDSPMAAYCLMEQPEKWREGKTQEKTTEQTKGLGVTQYTCIRRI